jgi:hypothetical protein
MRRKNTFKVGIHMSLLTVPIGVHAGLRPVPQTGCQLSIQTEIRENTLLPPQVAPGQCAKRVIVLIIGINALLLLELSSGQC